MSARRTDKTSSASVAMIALAVLGCAPLPPAIPPGAVLLTPSQHERLERAAARLEELREQFVALAGRVQYVEQRVGLAPLDGARLQRGAPADVIRVPRRSSFVAHNGARAVTRSLSEELDAHPAVVVAYWATWCKPCTSPEELEHLDRLERQLEQQGAGLVSIAVDGLGKVQSDARASTWHYPLWQHDDGHLEMLPRRFLSESGVGLPLFLVVGRGGRIRYFYKRKLDDGAVRDLVSAAGAACRGS